MTIPRHIFDQFARAYAVGRGDKEPPAAFVVIALVESERAAAAALESLSTYTVTSEKTGKATRYRTMQGLAIVEPDK